MGWAIQKGHKITYMEQYNTYMPSIVGVVQEGLSIVIATTAERAAVATTQQAAVAATAARALAATAAAFSVHRHSVHGP